MNAITTNTVTMYKIHTYTLFYCITVMRKGKNVLNCHAYNAKHLKIGFISFRVNIYILFSFFLCDMSGQVLDRNHVTPPPTMPKNVATCSC